MSWVNQIISAVEAGGKVAWSVFLSCAAALVLEHFFPDLFAGLPEWAFPIIRIVAIFSLVLSITAIFPPIVSKASALWQIAYAPLKRQSTRRKLLHLHIAEVAILCRAIAQGDRTIWIKPDLAQTISLQDKGLIRHFWCGAIPGDGTTSFEIPKDVWRVLLSMEEFGDFIHEGLLLALKPGQFNTEAIILACLPQAHPAVRAKTEQHAASTKEHNNA